MKVLVLGATGGTGRLIVHAAAAKGHSVVAIVRSVARAQDLGDAQLVEGNVLNKDTVATALDRCDAVVSSLGTGMSPFTEVTFLSTATRTLITAMMRQDVQRLVCITGMGAGDSRGHGGFLYDRLILPLLLRNVYQDKDRQEAAIRASQLNWVIIRPTVLNDGLATGRVLATTDLSRVHGGKIARADVANFVVDQLTDDRWVHQTPLITDLP